MAEEPEEEEEEDISTWETEDGEDDEEQETTNEDEEDYVLRGLRFMTDQIEVVNGWHDYDDNRAEDEFVTRRNAQVREIQELEQRERDDATFITQGLLTTGVTTEMLVMCLLGACHEEYINSKQFDQVDRSVFGKIRSLINIRESDREQNQSHTETPVSSTPVSSTPVAPEPANNPPPIVRERPSAEPKIPVTPVRLLDSFNECLAE